MTTSLREPPPVAPKGRPRGSKQKLTRKEMKHELSTKRNLSGFEYVNTIEDQELAAKVPEKLSQVPNIRRKKKEVVQPMVECAFNSFIAYIPNYMHEFIIEIIDVENDENCSFQYVVAELGFFEEDGWLTIRKIMIADLVKYKDKYDGSWDNWFYQDLLSIIDTDKIPCLPRNWMDMPVMGYIIASAFNCVVVFISNQLFVTFFPHSDPPSDVGIHWVVCLAHVRDCHFVRVKLKDGAPFPPIATWWKLFHTDEAMPWMEDYVDRLACYLQIRSIKNLTTIDIPITLD